MSNKPRGFIRKRKLTDGSFRYRTYIVTDGREKALGSFGSRRNAEAHLRQVEKQIAGGTFGQDQTLADFYQTWIVSKHDIRESTRRSYQRIFERHILPRLGEKKLDRITPKVVQEAINDLAASGLSPATVQLTYRYLRACLNTAVLWREIPSNPCKGIILPRLEREELLFLEPPEIAAVLEELSTPAVSKSGKLRYRENERALIATLAYSGLRVGEALALRWRDIDFANRAIIVQRSWSVDNGFSEPKSSAGRRAVPLLPHLEEILQEQYRREESTQPDDLIFSRGNQPLDVSNVRRDFEKAQKAAGVKRVTIHSLRHGFASLLLSNGASIKAVQRVLGHSSAALTLSTYSHLLTDDLGTAALRVNEVITGAGGKLVNLQRENSRNPEP